MEVVKASISTLSNLKESSSRICLVDGFLATDLFLNKKYYVASKNRIDYNHRILLKLNMNDECVVNVSPFTLEEYSLDEKREIHFRKKLIIRNMMKRR